MKISPLPCAKMLFVCCAERVGGIPSCGIKGRQLLLALQANLDRNGVKGVELVPSGCLGHCAADPVVIAAPPRVWCAVGPADVAAVAEVLKGMAGDACG
ncbi:MAG: (2Fe-2S) ferredoxin domain-containing protein [Planctomycetes bacterium]|nr:(2Fe-2S) ferredoxin domain-containing protein [Planctomycetota bacterium]